METLPNLGVVPRYGQCWSRRWFEAGYYRSGDDMAERTVVIREIT